MKNYYHHIKENPKDCTRLFGIDSSQMFTLIEVAVNYEKAKKAESERSKVRVNAPGGGRSSILSQAEEISLCLFYLRNHPTFIVLGVSYGVSESSAHNIYHYWLKILRQCLPCSQLESLGDKPDELDAMLQNFTELNLLVDSFEQPCQRPQDKVKQKSYYSGKKKQHTFKNQVLSLPMGNDILDLIIGASGPTADQELLRQQQQHFKPQQQFRGDKGYQGVERTLTPIKKPRKKDFSDEQLSANRTFAQERIYIEHLIRIIKIWRVAKEQFRLRGHHYANTLCVVCGLVRLRLSCLNLDCSLAS